MKMVEYSFFDQAYAESLKQIMAATPCKNERTGKYVRARPGIVMHVPPGHYPLLRLRDIRPLWTCAEIVWFLSGSNDPKWMHDFGFKVWDQFADPMQGRVWSATGYRWRRHFDVDQVKAVIDKLSMDQTSRQAVLLSWDPYTDLVQPGPNAPCVMIWHFHILEGKLFVSTMQRSADMYFGLPHDILGTKLIQEFIAAGLGIEAGGVSYLISNAHLYEDQWPAAEEMIYRSEQVGKEVHADWDAGEWDLGLTRDDFSRAMVGDQPLVREVYAKILKRYKPWPAITGPKLVI